MTQPYDPTLAEYTSRHARHMLVQLCHEAVTAQQAAVKPRPKTSPTTALARRLGVHVRTVQRWLRPDQIQSCNVNADAIITLALQLDPEGAEKALTKDLERHSVEVDAALAEMRQEVVAGVESSVYPSRVEADAAGTLEASA
ncbi:MAG: hypothetical protein ABIJ47_06970 [Candidatus Bathyarchaeota archaeon]